MGQGAHSLDRRPEHGSRRALPSGPQPRRQRLSSRPRRSLAAGRPATASFGGRTATRAYDSLSRLTSVTRTNGTSSTYTYEIDSDLATLTHAFASGSTPTSATWTFTSDASAKVTGITISAPVFEWTPPEGYGRTYGAASNLNQVTSEDGVPVSWNADGNMTSDGVNTYSWTWGNRMMGASRSGMTATYDYDSDDRRTKKTVNGVVTRTMWSGADEVGEYNAAGTLIRRFIPDGSGGMDARLMTVEANGTAYWHHTDRQGSVVATSNAAGQVVATATYSPHGEFGTGTTAPPTGSPFGYTGRQYDPETGLYQYRARYYSPRLGVFLSTDPIGTKDDPNLYLYVGADPVNFTDPTGMCMASRIGTESGSVCRDWSGTGTTMASGVDDADIAMIEPSSTEIFETSRRANDQERPTDPFILPENELVEFVSDNEIAFQVRNYNIHILAQGVTIKATPYPLRQDGSIIPLWCPRRGCSPTIEMAVSFIGNYTPIQNFNVSTDMYSPTGQYLWRVQWSPRRTNSDVQTQTFITVIP